CDLRMPRLDGPAFYEALVSAGSPAKNRILFITGDTLAPRTLEFLESRALPYLAKPFLVEELNLAVNRMLERNREPSVVGPVSLRSKGRAGSPSSGEEWTPAQRESWLRRKRARCWGSATQPWARDSLANLRASSIMDR